MNTLRILIVDDEPAICRGVERALRQFSVRLEGIDGELGFTVAQAHTAEEGLAAIDGDAPDILLLDLKLPGMSGLDMLDRVGQHGHDMQTVLVTAYASLDTAVQATKRGTFDVLAKPFTPDELRSTIAKVAQHIIFQRQARRATEEKREARFEFVSLLAHELKAPLAAVGGYVEILKDRDSVNESGLYDDIIERSLARIDGMRKLINDLLDLTKIESGRRVRTLANFDLFEVARTCIDVFRVEAAEHDVAVTLKPARGPLPVTADREEMEIILNNLVSNAVKYNRRGGRVDVSLAADDSQITISVADMGIGMSEEEAAQVFREFSRVKSDKTRHIAGSGLGLAIVKRIASLYDGEVSVASEQDVGSTFTVVLRQTPSATP